MKVRFERLEMDAQIQYARAAIHDFQKRVGSLVNSSSSQPPEMIVPLGNSGLAETRNLLRSLLTQSMQVTVTTRQGTTEPPLMPFLEKTVEALLEESKLDGLKDNQRVTFLLDNQVNISATLGEIKRLSKLDENQRFQALKDASDHFYATSRGASSSYSGSLQVGVGVGRVGYKVGVSANVSNSSMESNAERTKNEKDQIKQSFDKLMQEFQGKVPTLSGIQIDDSSLSLATKKTETSFQHTSFFVDYTLHRFPPVSLTGATEAGLSLSDSLRLYYTLKADYDAYQKEMLRKYEDMQKQVQLKYEGIKTEHDALQKLLGSTKQVTEAKENMEKLKALAEELKQKSESFDKTLANFDKNSKEMLAKVDQESLAKLSKEIDKLKSKFVEIKSANSEADFKMLEKGEQPPSLDCTGPLGVDAKTVLAAQKAWAEYLGETSHIKSFPLTKDGTVTVEMCLIPPGKYYRGSPETESDRRDNENQSIINITEPLWVSRYEVTQKQYQAVTGVNPSHFAKEGGDAALYPVEKVSYEDCMKFTEKASSATGAKFRLLTESEWEYAYRAGTRTKFYHGNSNDKLGDIAHYDQGTFGKPAKIGSKLPNAFGLYDMAGNVWEWCSDWYAKYNDVTTNPKGPEKGATLVTRGGSWFSEAASCRASLRYPAYPHYELDTVGIRLSLVPEKNK